MSKCFCAILPVVLLLAASPFSYSQARQDSSTPIKLSADLVVVDALVIEKKTGHAVGNLKKEDFFVYEDGVRQDVTHFIQDRLPLSLVVLLDTSSSVWPVLEQMRERTIEALGHLKPEDEVAVMATATRTQLVQDFTTDRRVIAGSIQGIDKKALGVGGIRMHEALYLAALQLRKASHASGRRAIIVVTDNISTQLPGMGHSEKEALHELFEAGVAVCALHIDGLLAKAVDYGSGIFIFRKLVSAGDIYKYANKTGGVVLKGEKEGVNARLAELIDHLRTRYTLAYLSSNQKTDGGFRKIKVKLSPDAERRHDKPAVQARQGYYARRDVNEAARRPK